MREDPAGSGPLAGIGAGLAQVSTPFVGVIAADMPFALPVVAEALSRLRATTREDPDAGRVMDLVHPVDGVHDTAEGSGWEAVVPIDPEGYRQPLCAAYRTDALRAALAALGPLG